MHFRKTWPFTNVMQVHIGNLPTYDVVDQLGFLLLKSLYSLIQSVQCFSIENLRGILFFKEKTVRRTVKITLSYNICFQHLTDLSFTRSLGHNLHQWNDEGSPDWVPVPENVLNPAREQWNQLCGCWLWRQGLRPGQGGTGGPHDGTGKQQPSDSGMEWNRRRHQVK